MPIEILMPALSPTMTEGNLVKWLKKEGDTISSGTVIAEIETDKATMEVEAVDEGKLAKILIPEGSEGVKVNQPIAILLEEGEEESALEGMVSKAPSVAASPTPQKESEPVAPVSAPMPALEKQTSQKSSDRVFASPLAKRLAQENSINLGSMTGSGPRGRIIKQDIEEAMASKGTKSLPFVSSFNEPITRGPSGEAPYEVKSLNNMRKVIAQRLTQSKQTVPHFYLTVEVNLDKLMALRSEINHRMDEQKLSVNDFIVRACALALIAVPEANVSWQSEGLYMYKTADISVAVAIDGGLITPVVKSAEHKSLRQISAEIRDLARRAREGKLAPEEFQGGTFTLSNLGMYGITQFDAILNPPQACILAVGKGEKRPIVVDDQIKPAMMMTCTLSVDHRAVDGAVGSNFLKNFKELLEDPLSLLL